MLALSNGLDASALRYLSGFLAGIAAERDRHSQHGRLTVATSIPIPVATPDAISRATVLYASQTGNGRRVAERLHRQLESQGLAARLINAADFKLRELALERLLFLVVSTHGDGDAPDDARALVDFIASRKAPRLEQLRYSVLALGDSSYPRYCETGRQFDEKFAALGAQRLAERIDCDVDYQPQSERWTAQALVFAREQLQSPHIAMVSAPPRPQLLADRDAPVEVELLVSSRLTARNSDHPVSHLEIAAPSDRLSYEPGDALGVWHDNPEFVAADIAASVGAQLGDEVTLNGQTRSLRDWLVSHREITRLARPFLDAHAARAANVELDSLRSAGNGAGLREMLRDWQPLDLLTRFPAGWSAAELLQALRPLTPRLYSIASSRAAVGDEAHLTVAAVDYRHFEQRRVGSASHYLTNLDMTGRPTVRAYIEPNPRFKLPADPSRDIIMIGPGTGVAPFRGFLQHRIESGGRGRHWLFFGARHLFADFLYQTEWLDARRKGTLQRLDVAFSRDQPNKVYVQDRIREQGAELARWIEGGAHVYVCGDAQRMAIDVHAALAEVLVKHTGRSAETAGDYLNELADQRRYARDVY